MNMICSFQAIGGNIMTASPISDLNPVLMAARCPLTLAAAGGIPAVWKLLMLAQQCWSLMGCQFLSYEETRGFASPPLDGMPILCRVPQGGIVRGGLKVSTTPSFSPPPPPTLHSFKPCKLLFFILISSYLGSMNLISGFLHHRKKKKSETGWEFLYWLQKNNFASKWNIGWYFYSIHRKGATCISLLVHLFLIVWFLFYICLFIL